jgi:poly(A) polymerase Pap1
MFRATVLAQLEVIVKAFVYDMAVARSLPDDVLRIAGGKVFTFGSYRLGVYNSGKFSIEIFSLLHFTIPKEKYPRKQPSEK